MHEIGRLKKEALLAIGYSLDRDAIREMRNTFRAFDTTGNGVISLTELQVHAYVCVFVCVHACVYMYVCIFMFFNAMWHLTRQEMV